MVVLDSDRIYRVPTGLHFLCEHCSCMHEAPSGEATHLVCSQKMMAIEITEQTVFVVMQ